MSTARPLVQVELNPISRLLSTTGTPPTRTTADRAAAERYLVERVLTLVGVGAKAPTFASGSWMRKAWCPSPPGQGAPRRRFAWSGSCLPTPPTAPKGSSGDWSTCSKTTGTVCSGGSSAGSSVVHARLSDGKPNVWHLSSASGAFQALVVANRFDTDHIRLLRSHDVRRTVLGLRRSLNDAYDSNNRVTALTNQISEVRAFDRGLAELERRDWRPDQTGGLGTLRKLGLLASMEPPAPSSTV